MSYLLDTNICIALLKGSDPKLIKKIRKYPPSCYNICSIVKAELLYGAYKSKNVDTNLSVLEKFFAEFPSLPFDDNSAEYYGTIRTALVKAGTPIGANDLLIASIAQANRLVLMTRNKREFSRVPGLKCEWC
jgi:tRNA(fMet)-specific endonuclease VapC